MRDAGTEERCAEVEPTDERSPGERRRWFGIVSKLLLEVG